jgi:hypothetical protein
MLQCTLIQHNKGKNKYNEKSNKDQSGFASLLSEKKD